MNSLSEKLVKELNEIYQQYDGVLSRKCMYYFLLHVISTAQAEERERIFYEIGVDGGNFEDKVYKALKINTSSNNEVASLEPPLQGKQEEKKECLCHCHGTCSAESDLNCGDPKSCSHCKKEDKA